MTGIFFSFLCHTVIIDLLAIYSFPTFGSVKRIIQIFKMQKQIIFKATAGKCNMHFLAVNNLSAPSTTGGGKTVKGLMLGTLEPNRTFSVIISNKWELYIGFSHLEYRQSINKTERNPKLILRIHNVFLPNILIHLPRCIEKQMKIIVCHREKLNAALIAP